MILVTYGCGSDVADVEHSVIGCGKNSPRRYDSCASIAQFCVYVCVRVCVCVCVCVVEGVRVCVVFALKSFGL